MATELITVETSTAALAAIDLLKRLDLSEPPITPGIILDRLNLTTRQLPTFDLERLSLAERRQFGSVRGLLSPSDRTIYVHDELSARQAAWLVYHETGHVWIEWHCRALFLDSKYTLRPWTRVCMEKEANEFAANLQFLGPRFLADADYMPFSVGSALELAYRYASSIESTIHHYVQTRSGPVVCLVLQPAVTDAREPTLKAHYFIKPQVSQWWWDFGCNMGDLLPPDDPTVQAFYEGRLNDFQILEEVQTNSLGERQLRQTVSNGRKVFVLAKTL